MNNIQIENKIKELECELAKYTVEMNSKKLVCNSSFGKLGSKYSPLYAPDLMLQVTISGQLALLMLVEALELAGIPVVSGNTDGIVIRCPKDRYNDLNLIVKKWEIATGLETEETRYKELYIQSVNNYIAIKEDNSYKAKGCFSKPGLSKNPTNIICTEAVTALIVGNIPVEETICNCKDIKKFITVRAVKGGAYKDNIYLGKIIRWFYGKDITGTIQYIMNNHTVPNTEGAIPIMDIPDEFPNNVNHQWYIDKTNKILHEICYYKTEKQIKFF